MPTLPSVCPLDCPDRCSLEVEVEGDRVVAITGSRANPVTEGYICAKVRRFGERLDGPDRLLRPMRRTGPKGSGRFEAISWDEALETIARSIRAAVREHGGEAVLPFCYGGSNGLVTHGSADEALFRGLGASRLARTVCAAPTGAAARALYGAMASADFPDAASARLVLLWGANPKHSNIHLMPALKAAREAGGRVILIDPRRTCGPGYIDEHLPVYPGSDAAVALAMIGHLERTGKVDRAFLARHAVGWERLLARAREWTLERAAARARVEPGRIAAIAEAYAAASPALVRCGWGLERNRNGEAAAAAILALPAVAGKFGVAGGGWALASSPAYRVDDDALAGAPEPATRVVNMNHLGRALLEESRPPIKVVFVYDANPAVTIPDSNRVRRGLLREDLFTVVFDQVMTDTALYADVLLPATTFLEHTEISASYGGYGVQIAEPVVAPRGEARPNHEVFALLAERLGVARSLPRGEALLAHALAAVGGPLGGGLETRLARLRRDRFLPFDFPGSRPVQFVTAFPGTPDGTIHLWPDDLGVDPYAVRDDPGDGRHPLALISPATDHTISSTLGEIWRARVPLEMHPDDAAARGLVDGQEVRVHNRLGEVRVRLRLSRDLRPGVVLLPKGIWNRHTLNGSVGAALVPDDVSEASGGACFNDARVEVAPAP